MPIELIEPASKNDEFSDEARLLDLFGYLVRKLDRITDMLQGPHDTTDLRINIKKLEEKCKDLAQQYQSMFLDGNAATHANPNNIQLMKYRNLLSLFEKILQKENQLERQKMKSLTTIKSQKANSSEPQHNDDSSGQLEDGQQALLAPLSQHEKEELEQREKDIKQIHNSVQLINEIFTDLGIIVMQQQDLVDCVELNMENAAADIHQANREIFITTETTQRNRFRCCGLPIGLLLFLGGMLTLLAWFLMKF